MAYLKGAVVNSSYRGDMGRQSIKIKEAVSCAGGFCVRSVIGSLFVGRARICLYMLLLTLPTIIPASTFGQPVIMVLGDSLVAGHGLPQGKAFPDVLERKLEADGIPVQMINAGVSGDTTAGGLARLEWSLAENPDAAIVVLGGNDLLRGLLPEASYENLDAIIQKLRSRGVAVLLAGMQAPRNFGAAYADEFDSIYRRLVAKHELLFYPFFLDGVALQPDMNLSDGMHPNSKGIEHIASKILPLVKALVAAVEQR